MSYRIQSAGVGDDPKHRSAELVGLPVAVCLQLARRLKPMEPVCRVSDAQIGVLSSASIAVTGTPNPSFFAPPSYLPLW